MKNVYLKSLDSFLSVGYDYPVRINCSIGANTKLEIIEQRRKIDSIFAESNKGNYPDIMMDLSTLKTDLYSYIYNNYKIPVGVVPAYLFGEKKSSIEKNEFLDLLYEHIENGISFFTLHFTATLDLYKKSLKTRKIPTTSRGGAVLIKDSIMRNGGNILQECLDEIIEIALNHNITLNLGATFRPSGIVDALDDVHIEETNLQLKIAKYLEEKNVSFIVENVGHIDLKKIEEHSITLREFQAPIMPLGPIPTDIAFELDDIAAAIGATFSGYYNIAHIINAITSSEHSNSSIGIKETLIALKISKLVAHIVNISKGFDSKKRDLNIYNERAKQSSCILNKNCNRCDSICPLNILK